VSAVEFHGLRIATHCHDVDDAPLRSLFATFAAAPDHQAHLALHVRCASAPADLRGFRQTFKHGARGFERSGEFLLLDGDAHVRVSADGRFIDAQLPDGADVETTLLIALAIALRHHGLYHMHAGALVRADGTGVLVLGASGAGKSTVTVSLLEQGARFLGDDAVFLGERDGGVRLLGLPRPFHLGETTCAAFPSFSGAPLLARGKRSVPLQALPGRLALAMDAPRILLFPTVARAPITEIAPLSPADAFGRALFASALAAVDGVVNVAAQLALLRQLIDGARAYELRLGADALGDPGPIVAALASIARVSPARGGRVRES
jgi:hypothetical protein